MKLSSYNPFSQVQREARENFGKLTFAHKTLTVIATIVGGIIGLPFFGIGGIMTGSAVFKKMVELFPESSSAKKTEGVANEFFNTSTEASATGRAQTKRTPEPTSKNEGNPVPRYSIDNAPRQAPQTPGSEQNQPDIGAKGKVHDESENQLPPLLSFGQVRRGTGQGKKPELIGSTSGSITTWSTEDALTVGVACCFHTDESHEEIMELIRDLDFKIRTLEQEKNGLFRRNVERQDWTPRFVHLMNNLARLHKLLPGKNKASEVKIYWSERVEQTLIPYLMQEDANLDNLVFTIVSGEHYNTPCQAGDWNPNAQLQFVGIGTAKIFDGLSGEVEQLLKAKNEPFPVRINRSPNPIMDRAYEYQHLAELRDRLRK